jgi:hypothetical protein
MRVPTLLASGSVGEADGVSEKIFPHAGCIAQKKAPRGTATGLSKFGDREETVALLDLNTQRSYRARVNTRVGTITHQMPDPAVHTATRPLHIGNASHNKESPAQERAGPSVSGE